MPKNRQLTKSKINFNVLQWNVNGNINLFDKQHFIKEYDPRIAILI